MKNINKMNPTLSCPSIALGAGERHWKRSLTVSCDNILKYDE